MAISGQGVACGRRAAPIALAVALLCSGSACKSGSSSSAAPEPERTARGGAPAYDPDWEATQNRKRPRTKFLQAPKPKKRKITAQPTAPIRPSADDPVHGMWTLDDALAGLPPGDRLIATIRTTMGDLTCELWPHRAPLTVANFVGLARGMRPWKTPEGKWKRRPAYEGTSIHRVIPGFAVQGGSPTGRTDGGPGYAIPDEIWEDANHDRAGLLCMATIGKNTGGMQFFITDGPTLQLDGGYPIFGECGPLEQIHAIARVDAHRGRPRKRIAIESVAISRPSTKGDAPGAPSARARPKAATSSPSSAPSSRPRTGSNDRAPTE